MGGATSECMAEDATASAAYMAGVLEAQYESGDLSEQMAERVNEYLEDDDMDHVAIRT